MLRNLGIVSSLLFMSQFLAVVHCGDSNSLTCKNKRGKIRIVDDGGDCQCSVDSSFEDGYTYTAGIGAYKFHNLPATWNTARKICGEEGAHLAIIDSDAEREELHKLYEKEAKNVKGATHGDIYKAAWLGAHDQFKEGDWVTVLGDSLDSIGYMSWTRNSYSFVDQPDNYMGNQNCAALILQTGYMGDFSCDWKLPFICEKSQACF